MTLPALFFPKNGCILDPFRAAGVKYIRQIGYEKKTIL